MGQLIYPRSAAAIAARARMALGAYRGVPGHEAANELDRWLHDMWCYGYFSLRNGGNTALWESINHELFDTQRLFKPSTTPQPQPAQAAHAASHAITRFEHATDTTPSTESDTLHTRAEVEQAAYAAVDRLRLDHRHDRQFIVQAFLDFLDAPDSTYPSTGHHTNDDQDENRSRS
ncbi:hypothetical protein ACFU99_14295 [Streptomyces sp. NPDC057654]|uniref:hypothetical protein n=1 Tax=Streptomyces sp. NPDC057654 TaxID=3346196 RepID=UPI0036C49757